jgi:large subunit ribosomal protein L3
MQGLIGKKLGMTQVYGPGGRRVAVTVIEAGPCLVTQCKCADTDGYEAAQLGFGEQKESRMPKALLGRFKKLGVTPRRCLKEFRVDKSGEVKDGDVVTAAIFEGVTHVDITGITKGRGFQGVVRRHGMSGGPLTHGGHSKRRVGSVGQNAYPARIQRGKRMPGHMGQVRVTLQNLRVVELRGAENLLLVEGAVPGPTGTLVEVRKALKKAGKPS